MSEHIDEQYAHDANLAELVKDAVQDSLARAQAVDGQALRDLPFRERLRARRPVRPQSSLAIASGQTYGRTVEPSVRPARAARVPAAPVKKAPAPMAVATRPASRPAGLAPASLAAAGGQEGGEKDGLADTSQFAFAAIAVMGLAGLTYMATENAFSGPADPDASPFGPDEFFATDTSVLALAVASAPVAGPLADEAPADAVPVSEDPLFNQLWEAAFDYARLAADLEVHRAEYDLALAEAAERAGQVRLAAGQEAAAAIAEAEAARVAEEQRLIAEAEVARLAAEEAEKVRLAEEEAARVAEEDARRLAQLEIERKVAAEAEARRFAELEARRLAAAEAEARRLADEKAARLAALEAARKQQENLPDIILAAAKVSPPVAGATPAISFKPHEGSIPGVASLKPSKPPQIKAMARPAAPATRAAPAVLKANAPTVRPLASEPARAGTQKVEDFMASRVARTASISIPAAELDGLKTDFLSHVEHGADHSEKMFSTPDGRRVSVLIEQTFTRKTNKASVRTITYSARADSSGLVVSGLAPEQVSITCRDISYSFAGQERGRFAACESLDGGWTVSRASDPEAITIAGLGEPMVGGLR